ncbi:MAG: NAD(P)/FAD-dependent oxidoreductase [Haloferacaceae archaeon]
MDTADDVVVIGAGAVGVSTAYHLADRGAAVTLLDSGHAAGETTGKAAGLAFQQFHGPEDVRSMAYSLDFFRELDAQSDHFEFHRSGFLRIGTEEERPVFEREVEMQRAEGADVRLVDRDGVRDLYPDLNLDGVTVGTYAPGDGHADPHTFTTTLLRRAEALGVDYRPETPAVDVDVADGVAEAVETPDGRLDADVVVVTAGPWSKKVAALSGASLPLKPYRVQALVTAAVDVDVGPVYDAHRGVYFRSEQDGLLAGDGTEETESDPDDYKRAADVDFMAHVGDVLRARLPVDDVGVQNSWAGLGSATPDTRPLVGPVPTGPGGDVIEGLYAGAGLQAHGFMRSPTVGRALAAEILDGETLYPEYLPTRFDGDVGDFPVREMMAVGNVE